MLKSVEIEGFKSFGAPGQRVELTGLNFLVGANASGKTNFVSALRFLQNAVRQDVEFAVNDLGGTSEVRNKLQRKRVEGKYVRVSLCLDYSVPVRREYASVPKRASDHTEHVEIRDFAYTLAVDLRRRDEVPVIVDESLTANIVDKRGSAPYALRRDDKRVKITDPYEKANGVAEELPVPEQERARPALSVGFFSLPAVMFKRLVEDWSFFNISAHVARQSYREIPDASLGMFGENLAVVLHRLKAENGEHGLDSIITNLRGAVPGFESVRAVKTEYEARWALRLTEERIKSISPGAISDGTIRLLALMVIANLGTHKKGLIAIEEPENGIHPHLAEHLISVFRDTAGTSQIIATTHNPAFLDYLEPEEVLLCGKVDGFTKIRRAVDIQEIESFRKHFSLGELWVQGTFDGWLDS